MWTPKRINPIFQRMLRQTNITKLVYYIFLKNVIRSSPYNEFPRTKKSNLRRSFR